MSDSFFHEPYDPVATPNPAYDDDDLDPAPRHRSAWERRSLSQAMLARARARQDAIADAFVDALLEGKFSYFRLLMDLEQAAIAGEADAQQANQPTLAEILLPMLQRERAEAEAARRAAEPEVQPAPAHHPAPTPARPMLVASNPAQPAEPDKPAAPPQPGTQPGTTDLNAAANTDPALNADVAGPCRTHPRKLPTRKSQRRAGKPTSAAPVHGLLRTLHAANPKPYSHTVPIVGLTPKSRRKRRKSNPASSSNFSTYTTNIP